MPSAIEDQEVTLAQAMRLTGYTKQNIQKLIAAGNLQRSDRAKFKLGDLIRGVMTHLRAQRKTTEQTVAAQRLMTARAKEIELRTAVRSGQLMETAECFDVMDLVLGTLRATIESLPAQMSRDVKERRKAEAIVTRSFEKCREDLTRLANEGETATEAEEDEDQ